MSDADEPSATDWITVARIAPRPTTPPARCVWRGCALPATHVLTVGATDREMCPLHLRNSLGYVRDDSEYELRRHQRQVEEHQATIDMIDGYLKDLP